MQWFTAILLAPVITLTALAFPQGPPPPVMWYTWDGPAAAGWGTMEGDSLKFVLSWKQPPDTAEAGKVDSTVYVLRPSKAIAFYSGQAGAPGVNTRRSFPGAVLADSFKLARPVLGDSVTFKVTGFIQCRKAGAGGGCSVAGSAGFSNVHDFTPPPTSPSIRMAIF